MTKIDWSNVLAGFLLGLLPLIVSTLGNFISYIASPQRKKYRGRFFLYHWSLTEAGVIREKEITFTLSPRGKMRVKLLPDAVTDSVLKFKGDVLKGHGPVLYIMLRGDGNKEKMLLVLNDPLDPNFRTTTGVFAAVDISSCPAVGKILLSRARVDSTSARGVLGDGQYLKAPALKYPEARTLTSPES